LISAFHHEVREDLEDDESDEPKGATPVRRRLWWQHLPHVETQRSPRSRGATGHAGHRPASSRAMPEVESGLAACGFQFRRGSICAARSAATRGGSSDWHLPGDPRVQIDFFVNFVLCRKWFFVVSTRR